LRFYSENKFFPRLKPDWNYVDGLPNTAQRLQSAAEPGQIVINKASYEKVKQSFSCREIGMVNMKNKSEGVMIYEVLE
jgi:adenylate cyclase